MFMEILTGIGGDSVLFARYTGGDSVLVNKKEWGGFCPGGILSYTRHHVTRLRLAKDFSAKNLFQTCINTC